MLWELLVIELNDGGQGAGPELAKMLGTNTSLLNKFIKQRSPIPMRDARTIADRLVSYLRSVLVSEPRSGSLNLEPHPPKVDLGPPPLEFTAVAWKAVVIRDDIQLKISESIRLLGEVIQHATNSNLPPNERALTELERAQLIAVLKTTLKMLEAPMIETGLLKKGTAMLKSAAAKAIEKQVDNAFAFAAGYAAGQLTSLGKLL